MTPRAVCFAVDRVARARRTRARRRSRRALGTRRRARQRSTPGRGRGSPSGRSSEGHVTQVVPPSGRGVPTDRSAAASTSGAKPGGTSKSARIRSKPRCSSGSSVASLTTRAGIRSAVGGGASRAGRLRPERALVGRSTAASPSSTTRTRSAHPRRRAIVSRAATSAAVGILSGPEEDHRAPHLVHRVVVLRRVGEDLLGRATATRREHDATERDREQPVLADAVLEVLREVRGELVDGLVDVDPRRDAEAHGALWPPAPDVEGGPEVSRRVRGSPGRPRGARWPLRAHRRGIGRARRRGSQPPSGPGHRRLPPRTPHGSADGRARRRPGTSRRRAGWSGSP